MIFGQCSWRTQDGRCTNPAEHVRELPNRERLKLYPVCLLHAGAVDARAGKNGGRASADVVS